MFLSKILSKIFLLGGVPLHNMGCLYLLDWTIELDYWTDLFASKNTL